MDRPPHLRLHVPEPKHRPGEPADFSDLRLPKAGSVERPPVDSSAFAVRDLAYALIRVLDDDGAAIGPWDPKLDAGTLRRGLRAMLLTQAYDERMYRAQRQGKTSFYMKCTPRRPGRKSSRSSDRGVRKPPIQLAWVILVEALGR
ncbi:MAG: hypothetical protein ACREU4_06200 [Burkholderiales bacterium]